MLLLLLLAPEIIPWWIPTNLNPLDACSRFSDASMTASIADCVPVLHGAPALCCLPVAEPSVTGWLGGVTSSRADSSGLSPGKQTKIKQFICDSNGNDTSILLRDVPSEFVIPTLFMSPGKPVVKEVW